MCTKEKAPIGLAAGIGALNQATYEGDQSMLNPTMSTSLGHESPVPEATFKPFTWLRHHVNNDQGGRFAGRTMDIAQGIKTVLSLIHSNDLARDNGDAPLLNTNDIDRLTRLLMASADSLANDAEDQLDRINHNQNKAKS